MTIVIALAWIALALGGPERPASRVMPVSRPASRVIPVGWPGPPVTPVGRPFQGRQAAALDAQNTDRGERIMNGSCNTACHDLRSIETQALDQPGWTKEVKAMLEKGAVVDADDVPVLVEYLAKQHGPLPDGAGKDVLLNVCTRCHDLQRVRREQLTPEGWLEILDAMLNEGAPLTEQDLPILLRYLARNFGPPRQP